MSAWALPLLLFAIAFGVSSGVSLLFVGAQDPEKRVDALAITAVLAALAVVAFVLAVLSSLAGALGA